MTMINEKGGHIFIYNYSGMAVLPGTSHNFGTLNPYGQINRDDFS